MLRPALAPERGPLSSAVICVNNKRESTLSVIHQIVAFCAITSWGLGMYYWWQTNNNLRNGVSKYILLNPTSYFNSHNFTESGINTRNKALASFALMLIFAALSYFLRQM